MKKWKCSVCGYIHKGDEPPEQCPVCGADRSKFVELLSEETTRAEAASPFSRVYHAVSGLISKHHVHPIFVHIPNGVLPLSVIFIILSVLFHLDGLGSAAFYNMLFVVLTMPIVLVSGFIDWQTRYGGHLNRLFITKMICGALVFVISLFLVIWRILDPVVAGPSSSTRWGFLFIHLILLAPAVIAGFLGGKLVFKEVDF